TPIALNIVALSPVFGGYITISLRRQKGPFSREAYQALLKLPTSAAIGRAFLLPGPHFPAVTFRCAPILLSKTPGAKSDESHQVMMLG
ncbi:MAG TPA: hypothetical protein VNE63_14930, partial [Candidatus Acidoferrales bacterium]|nr:hypothetical protein [Candidatus Acidoferrales bacterium]